MKKKKNRCFQFSVIYKHNGFFYVVDHINRLHDEIKRLILFVRKKEQFRLSLICCHPLIHSTPRTYGLREKLDYVKYFSGEFVESFELEISVIATIMYDV